jgi:hypothetical protein
VQRLDPAGGPRLTGRGSGGPITAGSQWTFQYKSWEGRDDLCETFTFDNGHKFVGDNTSTGTWTAQGTLKFTDGVDYGAGDVYKSKLQKSGTYKGDFLGSVTTDKTAYSPFIPGALC